MTAFACLSKQGPLPAFLHKDSRQFRKTRRKKRKLLCSKMAGELGCKSATSGGSLQQPHSLWDPPGPPLTKALNPWVAQSQQSPAKVLGGLSRGVTTRYGAEKSHFLPHMYVLMQRGMNAELQVVPCLL